MSLRPLSVLIFALFAVVAMGQKEGTIRSGSNVSLWISQGLGGAPGDGVVVPLLVGQVQQQHHVSSFELELNFDDNLLDYNGIDLSGSLIQGWDLVIANQASSGRILVSAANTTPLEITTDQDSLLLNFLFTVDPGATPGQCSSLVLPPGGIIFNAGSPGVNLLNGQLCAYAAPPAMADLSLQQTITPDVATLNQQLTISLTLANNGPDPASGILVDAPLTAGLTYVSDNGGGSYSGGIWDPGPLASGASISLEIQVLYVSGATLVNSVEISASDVGDPDSTPGNGNLEEDDYDQTTVRTPVADLSLTNRVSNVIPFVGDPFTYTLTLTNSGPDAATNVAIRAQLPTGLGLEQFSASAGTLNAGLWAIPQIKADSSVTLSLTATAAIPTLKIFTAEVLASDLQDPDSSPNNQNPGEDDQDTASITARSLEGAVITIRNDDGPGEGLNDPTPATPAGGNPGTTIGEQRMHVLERAAAIWAAQLVSDVEIIVSTRFESLGCGGDAGTFAQIVPTTAARNFSNAPQTGVWYPIALANTLAGTDINGNEEEITAQINLDLSCLDKAWYLGLDGEPGSGIDMLTILVKELARGLGFTSFIDRTSGAMLFGTPDIFTTRLLDSGTGKHWHQMSNSERLASAAGQNLLWDGDFVDTAAPALLNQGIHSSGHVLMSDDTGDFAQYFQLNWDLEVNPHQVLEPGYQGANHEPGISALALFDLGWSRLGQSDLRLDLAVDNQLAVPGETAIFTLSLSNDGPEDATGVEVTDLLPGGLAYLSHTGPGAYNPANGVWTVGSLTSGDTAVLILNTTVQNGGLKKNICEVTASDQGDPDSSPNNGLAVEDDFASLTVGNADVHLELSASNSSPHSGETTQLFISVTNDGPDLASGLVVKDLLAGANPAPLSYISDNGNGSYDPETGIWHLGTLASGARAVLEITVGMNISGSVSTTAELIAADVTDPDSTPGNHLASEDDQASLTFTSPIADLSLHGVLDNDRPFSGDSFTLTLELENQGPDSASNMEVALYLPSALSYVSHSGGSYSNGIWSLSSLAPSAMAQLQLTLQINNRGSFNLAAEVTTAREFDPDSPHGNGVSGQDDDVTLTVATPRSDLSLQMSATNLTANVDDTVTFILEIQNSGPDPASGILVQALLPSGLVHQSDTGNYNSTTGAWSIGDLASGGSESLTINALVTIPGTKVFNAEISAADQDDPDSIPGNGVSTEDDQAFATVGKADLELAMTVDVDRPFVGDELLFTLTLNNSGPDHATNVRVSANLPGGLELVEATGNYANGIWSAGQVNSDQPAQLQIRARSTATGSQIFAAEVVASDHVDPDSTPNNHLASEDDQVEVRVTPQSNASATIVIVNGDNPGEGFNDTRATSPVGGNSGTTLGQQRLIAFQHAADIWGSMINSDVTIHVLARFDPLTCSPGSGILGSAGPATVQRDFPGSEYGNTWYVAALANALTGTDLDPNSNEIQATFNSSIDNNNGCLSNTNWYYGLDGNNGQNIDLVTVLLHEMAHGLGFLSLVNSSGQRFMGRDDIYMRHLEDHSTGKRWNQMSDSERYFSGLDTNDLHWVGDQVAAGSNSLTAGANSQGHVEIYAPNPWEQGSSVSHFSKRLTPNVLMEPAFSNVIHEPILDAALLNDIGWTSQPLADLELTLSASNTSPAPQDTIDLSYDLISNGPGRTTEVEVRAVLPTDLVYISHTGPGTYDVNTGLWQIGSVESGDLAALVVRVRVNRLDPVLVTGEISHSQTEDPDSTPNNGNPAEDDQDSVNIIPFRVTLADLSLSMGISDVTPNVGDTLTLSLTVQNDGPDDARNVGVSMPLPQGLTYVSQTGDGSFNQSNGTWTLSQIGAADSALIQLQLRVTNDASKQMIAEVVLSDQNDPDSTPGNGNNGEDDYVAMTLDPNPVGTADLSLDLFVDNQQPEVDDEVVLTLAFHNDGPDTAQAISSRIDLSQGLTYVSHSGVNFDPASGLWTPADLVAGGDAELLLTARVTSHLPQQATGEILAVIQHDPDSSVANGVLAEDDMSRISLSPQYADLSLSLTVDRPTVELAEPVTFTLNIQNSGPQEVAPEALDLLPSGLSYISHSGDGNYTPGTGLWQPGTIQPGNHAVLSIQARLDVPGASTNNAQITLANHFDPDSTPGNNAAYEDDQDSVTVTSRSANGAVIVIQNADGPGEGFNDPTPVAPVGGNGGTTLGAQRLLAFQYAADIWGSLINSDVDIVITARFDALTCSAGGGVLGSAGPTNVSRDFAGAPLLSTWYHMALANAIAGTDLNGSQSEISATFNSSIDNNNGCLNGTNWYYGLDGNSGSNIDLVSVLLHEFGHGLGFSTFVNGQTGAPFYGYDDVYMRHLKDQSQGKNWNQMTNTQRAVSAVDTNDLVWTGSSVTAASDRLSAGKHGNGQVEMFAPNPFQPGSSVSHFSTRLYPNELMEPSYTGPNHQPGLAVNLMLDLGWGGQKLADLNINNTVDNPGASPGDLVNFTLRVTNEGPENAAAIEVSDLLPDGFVYQSDSGSGTYNPISGLWSLGDLNAGDSAALQIQALVQASGDKRNIAEITASSKADPDSTPGNGDPGEDDYDVAVVGISDLDLEFLIGQPEPAVGGNVYIRIILRNYGPDPVTGVSVYQPLPTGLRLAAVPPRYNPQTGIWTINELENNTFTYLDMNPIVETELPIRLDAEVYSSDNFDLDSTPANGDPSEDDQSTATLTPQLDTSIADLSLSLVNPSQSIGLGELLTFRVNIFNHGPGLARDVTISVPLPPGLTFVNASGAGTYDEGTGIWDDPYIASGSHHWLNITVQGTTVGNKQILAEVETTSLPDPDSTPGNGNPNEDDYATFSFFVQNQALGNIRITNGDGPGEGFNDPTPVSPVGGNPGTTLGEQRLIAFQYAADLLSESLQIDVPVYVNAQFNSLHCSATSGVLGSAGPTHIASSFNNPVAANTWHHIALANNRAGIDINGTSSEITASFNGDIDTNPDCLTGTSWYYGLDGNVGNKIDLVTVLIHEMTHGLGFSTFVNSSGTPFNGRNDVYMRQLRDGSTGKTWDQMNDSERYASARDTADLLWNGPIVNAAASGLGAGTGNGGRVRMFAPNPFQNGSSVSHFDTALSPNMLMEPYYTGVNHNRDLSMDLLLDVGWQAASRADLSLVVTGSNLSPALNEVIELVVQVTNDGPADASGITIDAPLPAGLSLVSQSGGYDSASHLWTPGSLTSGQSQSLTLSVSVDTTNIKVFTAEVNTASPADPDSTPGNHQPAEDDLDQISITPTGGATADLSLSLIVDQPEPNTGESIIFTLTLANAGPDAASGVMVRNLLPAGLVFLSDDGNYDPGTGNWSVGSINAGGSASLNISAAVNGSNAMVSQAEVMTADQADPDSTPANGNTAEDDMATLLVTPAVVPQIDISLNLTVDSPTPLIGSLAHFSLTLTNSGPSQATGLEVTLDLPGNFQLVSSNGPGTFVASTWSLPQSDSGTQAVLQFEALVSQTGNGTATAELTAAEQQDSDSTPGNGIAAEDDQDSISLNPRSGSNGALIVILNADDPGEGFNDPTPVSPVGGNNAITLGAQRLAAFEYAADLLGSMILSDVTIVVESRFDAMTCSPSSAILGGAGPTAVSRDFAGTGFSNTWYHQALANTLAGTDLNGSTPEISATFNSLLNGNPSCLGGASWYYGFDGNPGSNFDLVSVLLHEFTHGLGFSTFVNLSDGRLFQNRQDVYMKFLEDHNANRMWSNMNDSQRAASAVSGSSLHWRGPEIAAASAGLSSGATSSGHLNIYAPNPLQQGSSVSHFSTSLSPDELMEPFYSGPNHNPGMAIDLLHEIGWPQSGQADLELSASVDNPSPNNGDSIQITLTLTNNGPLDASGVRVATSLGSGLNVTGSSGNGLFDGDGWQVDALLNGDSAVMQLNLTIAAGGKDFRAEVSAADQQDPDSIPGNGAAGEDDQAQINLGNADLSLNMVVDPIGAVQVGDLAVWTLNLSNSGPDSASGIIVRDLLPAGLTFVASNNGQNYDPNTGNWLVSQLASGASLTLELTTRIDLAGTITNNAQVTAANEADPDSIPGNSGSEDDEASATITAVAPPTTGLEINIIGFFGTSCPNMAARLQVLEDGSPLTGLTSANFILKEDGLLRNFSLIAATNQGEYELAYATANPDGASHIIDLSVSSGDTTIHQTATAVNCNISGVTEIFDEQPVHGLAATRGSWLYFRLAVPAGQGALDFSISGGTGDADLYIRKGSLPDTTNYDYRPFLAGNSENVHITSPQGGDWYLGLHGVQDFADLNLLASYDALSAAMSLTSILVQNCPQITASIRVTLDNQGVLGLNSDNFVLTEDGLTLNFTLTNGANAGDYLLHFTTPTPNGNRHNLSINADVLGDRLSVSGNYSNCTSGGVTTLVNHQLVSPLSGTIGSWLYFKINVPAGQDVMEITLAGGAGDADLYVRFGSLPDQNNWDYRPYLGGNNEKVHIESSNQALSPGDWYIGVYGFINYSNTSLVASYWSRNLSLNLLQLSQAGCPLLQVNAAVSDAGGPISGLTSSNFQIFENDLPALSPDAVNEIDAGLYSITWSTPNRDGNEVLVTLSVTDAGSSASAATNYQNCTRDGSLLDVWVNQNHAAPAGEFITLPVRIQAVETQFQINSFELELNYDHNVLNYSGPDLANSLVENWNLVDDSYSEAGTVRINAANVSQLVLSSTDESVLIGLRFGVIGLNASCSDLVLPQQHFRFNDGTPLARPSTGGFCITPSDCPRALGDINGDGNDAQALDALQILNFISGVPTPHDPIPVCVADTNCSGDIGLIDAVEILRKNVEIIDSYCAPENAPGRGGTFQIEIPTSQLTADVGAAFTLAIDLTQIPPDPLYGYSFDLEYDPALLNLSTQIEREGTLTERWGEPLVLSQHGRLTVTTVFPLTPIEGAGTLILLNGTTSTINTGSTNLNFTRFTLATGSEPVETFGPFVFLVDGSPCFDPSAYSQLLTNWPGNNILPIIELVNCQ